MVPSCLPVKPQQFPSFNSLVLLASFTPLSKYMLLVEVFTFNEVIFLSHCFTKSSLGK